MRSLENSRDEFPICFALVKENCSAIEVIGHSRLNLIPNKHDSIWVESVVIKEDHRGLGYGKILMLKTEAYAQMLGFQNCILSTHDKQSFYKRLGYDFCKSVTIYGASTNKDLLPKKFLESINQENSIQTTKDYVTESALKLLSPPPPPPPPLPPLKKSDIQIVKSNGNKMFMSKRISEN